MNSPEIFTNFITYITGGLQMIEHNNFKKYLQQEILELQKLQKQLEVRLADTPTETLHILQK